METIVIATDFSPAADNAVKYGTDLAKFFGARIILVHAYSLPVGGFDSLSPLNTLQDLRYWAENELGEVKKRINKQLGHQSEIIIVADIGPAVKVLKSAIDKYDAQAAVIGMTGKTGALKRHVIGSIALDAAQNLPVPVIVVPEQCMYRPIKKIIFACDYLDTEQTTLPHLTKYLASSFDAEVEILHIANKEEDAVGIERAMSSLKKTLSTIRYQVLTLEGEEAGEIIRSYVDENDCDILMLNPKKHGFFQRLFHPTTTKELIFSVHKPMLFVHA